MEHITKALGLPTKYLVRPVSKLLAGGEIRREGQKRATKYFPAESASPAAAEKPARTRKRGK